MSQRPQFGAQRFLNIADASSKIPEIAKALQEVGVEYEAANEQQIKP